MGTYKGESIMGVIPEPLSGVLLQVAKEASSKLVLQGNYSDAISYTGIQKS